MSETDDGTQGQKQKTSKLAIASMVIGIVSVSSQLLVGIVLLLGVLGLILGIVALIKIKKGRGMLKGRGFAIAGVVTSAVGLMLGWYFLVWQLDRIRPKAHQLLCAANLRRIGSVMHIYSNENDGKYPTVDKWCDLLIECTDVPEKCFVCKGALSRGDEGRCHYAINPNCEPNSAGDIVLLFETKGGWNQFGGPEMVTFENHYIEGGCNILFNDGHVEFVRQQWVEDEKPERFGELKWGEEK
jgi:prepilin-type processing-associated H-X9-DG protein